MDDWGELDPTPRRAGPQPIPGDTWNVASGRHRALQGRARARRRWALIGAALAVVVAGVAVGLSLNGSGPAMSEPLAADTPLSTGQPATSPTTALPENTTPVTAGPPSASTQTPPAFAPLILQAENVPRPSRHGTQRVDLGNGEDGLWFTDDERGEIEFRSLAVPSSGTYRVTIVYAPDSEQSRTLVVVGSGPPVQVTLERGTGCCRQVSVNVSLSARGTLTLEPAGWEGSRPAIDRVEITRG